MSVQPDIDQLIETAVYLYAEGRRVTKASGHRLGLTGPQVTALKLLDELDALSLSDLSKRMSATNSTMTGLIDRMVRDGLVARKRSEEDRRVVRIELTERGRAVAAQVPVTSMEIFSRALRSLSTKDRAQLRDILKRLATHVRQEVARHGEQAEP